MTEHKNKDDDIPEITLAAYYQQLKEILYANNPKIIILDQYKKTHRAKKHS